MENRASLKKPRRFSKNYSKRTLRVSGLYNFVVYRVTFASTDSPAIKAELARLRAADKEREKVHNQKFKGMSLLGSSSMLLVTDLPAGFLNRASDKGKEKATS